MNKNTYISEVIAIIFIKDRIRWQQIIDVTFTMKQLPLANWILSFNIVVFKCRKSLESCGSIQYLICRAVRGDEFALLLYKQHAWQTRLELTDWFTLQKINWSQSFCSIKRYTCNARVFFAHRSIVYLFAFVHNWMSDARLCEATIRWTMRARERIPNERAKHWIQLHWHVHIWRGGGIYGWRKDVFLPYFWITMSQTNSQLKSSINAKNMLFIQKFKLYFFGVSQLLLADFISTRNNCI